jgi:hypothetical protein
VVDVDVDVLVGVIVVVGTTAADLGAAVNPNRANPDAFCCACANQHQH